jgi:DNA-binding transcriptional LysR family regulator
MLNLNHLRIFYYVAKHMSFTKGARALSISQPAVTNQVRTFQDSLNLRLFNTRRGQVTLTEEGRILYEQARRLFDVEAQIEEVIEDMNQLKVGVISVGTSKCYARELLPFLIAHFHESYPGITIRIDEGGALDIINRLLEQRNEIAIIAKIEENPKICFIPLCREDLLVILPPGHRLTAKATVSIEDLFDEPIIMREPGSGTRKLMSDLFEAGKFKPHCSIEAGSADLIKTLILQGKGVSIMSRPAALPQTEQGKLIAKPLEDSRVFLDVHVAYLKNHEISPPSAAFLKILENLAADGEPIVGVRTLISRLIAKAS